MKASIQAILSASLILLFTYAAISKLINLHQFQDQLYLQPFTHEFADLLLYALPASELLIALLLSFDRSRPVGLICSLALLLVFSTYIILGLLHYWNKVPCSCGGILSNMGWGPHLVFNMTFVLLNIIAILLYPKHLRLRLRAST